MANLVEGRVSEGGSRFCGIVEGKGWNVDVGKLQEGNISAGGSKTRRLSVGTHFCLKVFGKDPPSILRTLEFLTKRQQRWWRLVRRKVGLTEARLLKLGV